jgi:hypothetical protein
MQRTYRSDIYQQCVQDTLLQSNRSSVGIVRAKQLVQTSVNTDPTYEFGRGDGSVGCGRHIPMITNDRANSE